MRLRALTLLLICSCGYRPAETTLPQGVRSVRVELSNPASSDEPGLSATLAAALCRELSSAGVPASTAGSADAVLRARILTPAGSAALLARGARTLAARDLRLRLEAALFDREGRTLWRSGLLELESSWAVASKDPVRAEASRQRVLKALAAEAARRVVSLLTIGDRPADASTVPATR